MKEPTKTSNKTIKKTYLNTNSMKELENPSASV